MNQDGKTSPMPTADSGWAGEIALDLDMASAGCPDCKILLVEASSANDNDLMVAENTAVKLGAAVISNSFGGSENSSSASGDAAWFNHPGVAITVSAGDSGYSTEYPASSRYVIAVGGTSLVKGGGARGWSETVWGSTSKANGGTGSGCSSYISKPSWQKDTGCSKRTVGDVAAVADPNTGVSVYDSYGGSGWGVYGGTSASSPLVAAILAITGNNAATGAFSYNKPSAFFDVTAGANGSCGGSYLCTAKAGYDGPTGYGTPNGKVLTGGGGGTCTPSCSGKVCGDDGCGGSCGTCSGGMTCDSSGQCGGGGTCTPSCSGKMCGDDGCGGSCGTCSGGTSCDGSGQCGGGTSTCSHSSCQSGRKLSSGCDPCVTQICAADSYCCNKKWDSTCVSEVSSICGDSC